MEHAFSVALDTTCTEIFLHMLILNRQDTLLTLIKNTQIPLAILTSS